MKHIVEYSAKEDDKILGSVICYPKNLVNFKDMASTFLHSFSPNKEKSFGEVKIYSKSKMKSLFGDILSGNTTLRSFKMNNIKFLIDDIDIVKSDLPDEDLGFPRNHIKKM